MGRKYFVLCIAAIVTSLIQGSVAAQHIISHSERERFSNQRAVAAGQGPIDTLSGSWTYRSFRNDPNPDIPPEDQPIGDFLFGKGIMTIESTDNGRFRGRLSFGEDFQVALKGWVTYGDPVTIRFQGKGDTSGSKDWVYDYKGYLVMEWPHGVDQRPAIVGSIIRTEPHSDGQAKAGLVASWIAVKQGDLPSGGGGFRPTGGAPGNDR